LHETCKAITDSDAVSQFVLTRVAVTTWKVTFVYIIACPNQGIKVNSQLRQASSELRLFTQSLGLGVHILDIVFQHVDPIGSLTCSRNPHPRSRLQYACR